MTRANVEAERALKFAREDACRTHNTSPDLEDPRWRCAPHRG